MRAWKNKAGAGAYRSFTRRILNILSYILLTVIILAAVFLAAAAIQGRAGGTTTTVGGFRMLKVISGSMEPTIHTGAVIIIKEIEPTQLQTGDIVTFRSAEYDSQLVTHRIVKIESSPGGGLMFTTRGDANDADDTAPLPASQIKGTVVFSIPLLGYAMDFIQSREGLVLVIIVPCIFLGVYEIKQIRVNVRALKKKKTGQARDISED
ncbi:MAG: signal peptidase I [Clostridiales bacterium]|nr:signal peptidase I [Clostridiales bacterium]